MQIRIKSSLALFLMTLGIFAQSTLWTGCSSEGIKDSDPELLYKQAEEDIEDDRYLTALEKLRMLKNKFPYSRFSALAQLRIADVNYLQESYFEAASNYELFRDLHPKHEKVAYALFRIGESYYNDAPGNIARDMTSAQKALDAYHNYLDKYPSAEDSKKATERVKEMRNALADKEKYIADFYFKREYYLSAIGRYEKIIASYPDTDSASDSKEKLKIAKDAQTELDKEEKK